MTTPVAERVKKRREALRQAGLRPIQLWVPDTRKASFASECRRQSALLAHDPHEHEVTTWLEQATDTEGWV